MPRPNIIVDVTPRLDTKAFKRAVRTAIAFAVIWWAFVITCIVLLVRWVLSK